VRELRLRTPRLELRLPTDEEVHALYETAAGGIHPRDQMPFAVPWTDTLNRTDFVEFHRAAWDSWSPDEWHCNFVTFLDGRVIGTQAVLAKDFASTRTVETGSWLGQAFQNRGYGTEQRAAVLEFAFRGLRADAAVTGALVGNPASARVSEKLGYRMTGVRQIAPRGEPVDHFDYRIERDEWRSPVPVEIEGLDASVRQLFGA
jgi:RimJ/RimL family protein N-acetyltransferase